MSTCYEDILLDVGINPALRGFDALKNLCEVYEANPEAKYCTELLPRVGSLVGCSGSAVERRCRHAIFRALDAGNSERMEKVLRQSLDIDGTMELSRFVALCILAKRRIDYNGGEI